jgi:RNA polymerase sigma-70 factor (ECF subfamily)
MDRRRTGQCRIEVVLTRETAAVSPESANASKDSSVTLAFEDIYEANFDLVWRTARRLGVPESSCADVVQDTFIVLHRRFNEYDGRASVKGWLLGITSRVVADHRRRFRRKEGRLLPHESDSDGSIRVASSDGTPNDTAERNEDVRLLHDLLAELDENKREVLVLAQLEEMTVPEIAHALGVNVNTVYARLRAARSEFDAAYARHRARTEGAAQRAGVSHAGGR